MGPDAASAPVGPDDPSQDGLFWSTVSRHQRLMGVAVRAALPILFLPVALTFAPTKTSIQIGLAVYLLLALVSLWTEARGVLSSLRINLFLILDSVLVVAASYASGLQNSPLLSLMGTLLVAYTLQRGVLTGLVSLLLLVGLYGLGLVLESAGAIPVAPLMPAGAEPLQLTGGPIGTWVVTAIALICATWLLTYSIRRVENRYEALNRAIEAERAALERADQVNVQAREVQRLESLGRMAGGMAHEFNNLLTVILGYSRLAGEEVAQRPDAEADLEQVIQAANRGKQLVSQLVTYSLHRSEQVEVVDLNRLVQSTLPALQKLVPSGVKLQVELAEVAVKVHADCVGLEQALVNLVTNAVDAMPQGGVLCLAVRPEGDAMVVLTVADTGRGMDDQVRQAAFEAFFTTKPAGRGTGLGLSVVREMVAAHGGDVEIDSAPGQGTRVSLRLPTTPDEAASPAPAAGELPSGEGTILLVEDERLVRDVTRRALSRLGYRTQVAADAERAEELFSAEPQAFDLLVTDVMLPGRSGRELSERLHALRPDLPVLFISGYTDEDLARVGLGTAQFDLLRKPFGLHDLAEKVRELLSHEP